MHVRRGAAQLVELLDGRLEHLAERRADDRCLGPQLDTFDDPPAAHLKDLHHQPRGTELHAEDVAVAELGPRHLLLAVVQRLHGPHRVAKLRRLLEALARGGVDHAAPEGLQQPSLRPSRNNWVRRPRARPSAEQMVSTHGAMQRLMSYSRQARPRTGDHLVARSNAEQPVVSAIVSAKRAGMTARQIVAVALDAPRDDARERSVAVSCR